MYKLINCIFAKPSTKQKHNTYSMWNIEFCNPDDFILGFSNTSGVVEDSDNEKVGILSFGLLIFRVDYLFYK